MDTLGFLFFAFVSLVFLFSSKANGGGKEDVIGAIIDTSSRVGEEESLAMEMAAEDFNNHFNQTLHLIVKDSQSQPFQAALMAMDLIETERAKAILGPNSWEEAKLVAEIGSGTQTPILSFHETTPNWAIEKWPFLIQASSDHCNQMKAIAAIVQSWKWRQVTLLYEDVDSYVNGVFPYLSDALYGIDAVIAELVALPSADSPSSLLFDALMRLREGQCRVFILHSSLELALKIFETAKTLDMMEKDFVWIATHSITDMVHSIDHVNISYMQGGLGVKSYFSDSGDYYKSFYKRFRKRFQVRHPHEENHEPGIFAVQAYDAVWTVGLASIGGSGSISTDMRGQNLLEKILESDFNGLTSQIQFIDQKLPATKIFGVINIVGRSYRELGFWSENMGFSETVEMGAKNFSSMENLEPVIWPKGPKTTPKGWTFPISSSATLRIGVPTSTFKQFVTVEKDNSPHQGNNYTGFSIEVFKAAIEYLPYPLPYEFVNFTGSYDDLVQSIYLKEFDAVVGDVAIISKRYKWAEFSHPYTEPGLLLVSPVRLQTRDKAWLFMRPFTITMWLLTGIINIFNGFVVWFIERNHCPELKGPLLNQIGTLLWLAFNTLFSLHGEKMHSNLSRMAMVVWLFVALVITQSYTASLTSMLTLQKFEATVKDVEVLKATQAPVGYGKGSYVEAYLIDVLGFNSKLLTNYRTPEEYDQAFRNQSIKAAFIEAPLATVFLTKYCKGYTHSGPSFKIGGFGYAFPSGSQFVPDMSEAILKLSEQGRLRELENGMIASETCVDEDSIKDYSTLSLNSFWLLFMISIGSSTMALIIYVFHKLNFEELMVEYLTVWVFISAVIKQRWHQRRQLPRRVSDPEIGPHAEICPSASSFAIQGLARH
ncbi:Receptor, ligand binding region [Dillenia turbinata]|uniref:Glutamate receptor n=1 Tax=Dillenia turbinata TaxID=194707 RepID=A0AAN8W5R5_9MAGN